MCLVHTRFIDTQLEHTQGWPEPWLLTTLSIGLEGDRVCSWMPVPCSLSKLIPMSSLSPCHGRQARQVDVETEVLLYTHSFKLGLC